ncbi:hypothetical protein M378DRAFT_575153 [Amanita muscaria Koide BX008]|uniref:Uncharacterized protein n=1 Tax=Amanita muscaria (strain Koide BX008) TaxID=946122 RepID=A0A0C2X7P2_AMAMK|nr:hypothetical protein M378DRAFT_575153 [Amanita muscaria Koide BX008]
MGPCLISFKPSSFQASKFHACMKQIYKSFFHAFPTFVMSLLDISTSRSLRQPKLSSHQAQHLQGYDIQTLIVRGVRASTSRINLGTEILSFRRIVQYSLYT